MKPIKPSKGNNNRITQRNEKALIIIKVFFCTFIELVPVLV
ncbi:MAG: hypothetical protein ABIJ21_08505 [Nanoarchaeota archaeon]